MAMAESPALGILSAQAHRSAFQQQGAKSQGLAEAPIDRAAGLVGLGPRFQGTFDLGV